MRSSKVNFNCFSIQVCANYDPKAYMYKYVGELKKYAATLKITENMQKMVNLAIANRKKPSVVATKGIGRKTGVNTRANARTLASAGYNKMQMKNDARKVTEARKTAAKKTESKQNNAAAYNIKNIFVNKTKNADNGDKNSLHVSNVIPARKGGKRKATCYDEVGVTLQKQIADDVVAVQSVQTNALANNKNFLAPRRGRTKKATYIVDNVNVIDAKKQENKIDATAQQNMQANVMANNDIDIAPRRGRKRTVAVQYNLTNKKVTEQAKTANIQQNKITHDKKTVNFNQTLTVNARKRKIEEE